MQSPGQLRTWSQLSCWSKPPTLWQQPQKLLYMRSPVPLWSLCVSRSLFSDGNYLLFLNVSFQPCYLSHIPRLFKSHPSFFVLNSQILMPFYVWFFFLYENVHTKYPLLLCRWPSWNVQDLRKWQIWHSNPDFLSLQYCPHLLTYFTVMWFRLGFCWDVCCPYL